MNVLMIGGPGYFGKLLAGNLREEWAEDIDIVDVDICVDDDILDDLQFFIRDAGDGRSLRKW